jgi:hypothetical protein
MIQLGCTAILVFSASFVSGQNLPAIPKHWPANFQNDLSPLKELVEKRFKEYDLKIDKYNEKCGDGKVPDNDNALKSYCAKWSDELDSESLALDKKKESFMTKFNDYEKIFITDSVQKEFQRKEEERIRKIANQGKPASTHPFGEKIAENPDLSGTNVDLSLYWGGSKGTSPNLPDLNYGDKNLTADIVVEQKLAQKYPAFNEILVKENKLKGDESDLKKEGVTLYQEIKGKGSAATKEDWDKLQEITKNLKKVSEDLKKASEEKEKAKNTYKLADPFQ